HLKSGQLARIGRLLLQRGAHDGAQLVPAAWVDALHAEAAWVATGDPEPESTRYGYGVWRCTPQGAWRADGAYGQFLLVLPEQRGSSRSRPTSRVAAVRRSSAPCGRSCCPCCDGPPPLALCSDHHHWPFPDRTATTSLTYA